MTTKIKIHMEPTSKLVYFRVYRDNSPFSVESIDRELKRRPFVSFGPAREKYSDATIEEYIKSTRGLTPHFIVVKEEEAKIAERGPGLAKYAFDSEENLYTIMRKLCESTTIVNQSQTLPSSWAIHSKLTWSERVLSYAFAKRMITILKTRLRQLEETILETRHTDSIAQPLFTDRYAKIYRIKEKIQKEQELLNHFENIAETFKDSVVSEDMDKLPLNNLDQYSFTKLVPFHTIMSRIIPSGYYETIWERLLLNRAIAIEKGYLFGGTKGAFYKNIQALQSPTVDITQDFKKFVISPIKPR